MSEGTPISSSTSEYMEVDELEEMLKTIGTFGIFPGMPTAEHERDVLWFKPTGTGDADASSAANAATGAYDNISTYCTANQDDVCLYLQGSYDFNGAVGGLDCSVAFTHIFALGPNAAQSVNSNVAATAVISITALGVEVAGFTVIENTNTVEGILTSNGASLLIHDCQCDGPMENGIHLNISSRSRVYNNFIRTVLNDGIEVAGASSGNHNHIYDNSLITCGDNGIHINGDNQDENFMFRNRINGNAGTTDYGIAITLGDKHTVLDNWMMECGTWPISDTGSNNGWVDNHYGGALTGSHEITQALDQTETTITGLDDLDLWKEGHLYISIDATAVVDAVTMTVYLKEKIDGTNYRIVKMDTWNVPAGDVVHPTLDWGYEGGPDKARATVICDGDLAAARTIYWKLKLV